MLKQSLLVTLGSLRSLNRKIFAAENFLTAAFAFLLQNDRSFLKVYTNHLGFRLPKPPEVQVQRTYVESPQNIPDMVFSDRHTYIVQENKIDAPLRHNQLSRYAKLVKASGKKYTGLVYLRRKHSGYRTAKHYIDGVQVIPLTWDAVSTLIKGMAPHKVQGKSRWLREEVCNFLEFYKMTYPSPLDLVKLRRAWKDFEPQEATLKRVIGDVYLDLKTILDEKNYRVRTSHPGKYPGVYVYRNRGKLKQTMKSQDLWAWCGIYPWEDEIYAGVEVGWGQRYEEKVQAGFRNLLERNGFERYSEADDPLYPYEGYSIDKPLASIIGKSKLFEGQCAKAKGWFLPKASKLASLLTVLDRKW